MTPEQGDPGGADGDPGVVLLAEDDDAIALLVELALQEHRVLHVPDGLAAMEVLTTRHVDVLLTDVGMPRMDGEQLLAATADLPSRPPVLVLTGQDDLALRVRLLRAGANDLLRKPFAVEELQARVENLLHTVRLERSLTIRNQELDRYATHVAHDLKGPLSVVRGFAAIMAGHPDLPDELREPVGRITTAAARAERLVRALLHDATGGTTTVVDLGELVSEVADDVRERAPALRVEVGPLPLVVGRVDSLRQLVRNLLGNAAAYARPGHAPQVSVRGEPTADGRVRVAFADRGVGVPVAERHAVLGPGVRGSSGAGLPGSGLGLSAARAVVEAHGGMLWLADGPDGADGPGVSVVLRLPAAAPAPT